LVAYGNLKMNKKYSISVILPVYNEGGNIKKIIKETAHFLEIQEIFKNYEIIVVDDGSQDNTLKVLRKLINEISYLKIKIHYKNLGYGQALMTGVKQAKFEYVFFMDADGQFNIKDLEKLAVYMPEFEIILGYRQKREDNLYRRILGKSYSYLLFLFFGLKLKDVNCGYKVFKKEVLNYGEVISKGGVFYGEVLLKAKLKGYKFKEIPVKHFFRFSGKQTGGTLKVVLRAIVDLIYLKYFQVMNL